MKIHFEPNNGVSTASDLDLCIPINIYEFGSKDPKYLSISFDVDLSGIDESALNRKLEVIIADEDYIYGQSHDSGQSFSLTKLVSTLENVIPINHKMVF